MLLFYLLGLVFLGMKMTLFVPFTILIPWADFPSSFAKDISQIFVSGPLNRCLYSWETPYIWWVTALASWIFLNYSVNENCGEGFLLPLDLNLELGTSVYTLGGCTFCTLGGGKGTSGRIMFGPIGDMWTLCWKLLENFPSSYSMILGCTEGRGLVIYGRTLWGTIEVFHWLLLWRVFSVLKIICHLGKYIGELHNCDHLGVVDVGKWCLGLWVLQGMG